LNIGFHRRADVEECLKQSLAALQLDYVDLYLIHAPLPNKRVDGEIFSVRDGKILVDDVDLVETWQGMEDVFRAGKTKAVGLSNFNSKQIQRICENGQVKPHNLQIECHAYWPQNELVGFCKERNITITAYGPLGSPNLYEYMTPASASLGLPEPKRENFPSLLDDAVVLKIAAKHSKTPGQIVLRWLIQRGIAVIPKSSNAGRLKENLEVFDFALSADEFDELSKLSTRKRLYTFDFAKNHPEYPFNVAY